MIALGATFGLLPVSRIEPRALAMLALFLGLGVMTALSISWAADGGRAFVKTVQFSSVLGLFVLALFSSRPGTGRGWISGITGGLLIIILLAAVSRFFPGVGDDVELTANLAGVEGRLSWPLGYWNGIGAVAAIGATGLCWFGTNARARGVRAAAVALLPVTGLVLYLTSSRGGVAALILGAAIVIGCGPRRRSLAAGFALGVAGAMVLILVVASMTDLVHAETTQTARSDGRLLLLLTLVVTAVLFFVWYRVEPWLSRLSPWKPNRWQVAAGVVVALLAVVAADPVERVNQFTAPVPNYAPSESGNATTAHLLNANGSGRSEFWMSAIDAFESEPLRGIGAGGFETYYANNRDSGLTGRHTHSLPLQVLAELGIVGALLLLGMIVLTVSTAVQLLRAGRLRGTSVLARTTGSDPPDVVRTVPALLAIAAAGGVSMSIDWTAEFPIIVAPVVIAVACIVGPAVRPRPARDGAGGLATDLLASLAILVGGVSIWVAATGFSLASNLDQSRQAVTDGDLSLAESKARSAIDALPQASDPWIQLALIQELRHEYETALETVEEGIERSPNTSSNHLLKTRILLELGRDAAANRAWERGKSLDPQGAIFADDIEPADDAAAIADSPSEDTDGP